MARGWIVTPVISHNGSSVIAHAVDDTFLSHIVCFVGTRLFIPQCKYFPLYSKRDKNIILFTLFGTGTLQLFQQKVYFNFILLSLSSIEFDKTFAQNSHLEFNNRNVIKRLREKYLIKYIHFFLHSVHKLKFMCLLTFYILCVPILYFIIVVVISNVYWNWDKKLFIVNRTKGFQ